MSGAHSHHDHDHHGHLHFNAAFKVGILLNLAYVVVEVGYGMFNGSVSLISDGIHNLADVAGLGLSWAAFYLASLKPPKNFTYGYGRATILSAFLNAVILFVAVGAIGYEAVQRLQHPTGIHGSIVMAVAGIGIVVNALTALVFFRDRHHDLNISGAFWHMATDALVSLGVLISGLVIYLTGWTLIDPIMSFIILALIIYTTWGLLSKSLKQLMDSVPYNINITAVREALKDFQGILGFHDLHVWNLTSNQTAITVHITIGENENSNKILAEVNEMLGKQFGIHHTTIQMEHGAFDEVCMHGCDEQD